MILRFRISASALAVVVKALFLLADAASDEVRQLVSTEGHQDRHRSMSFALSWRMSLPQLAQNTQIFGHRALHEMSFPLQIHNTRSRSAMPGVVHANPIDPPQILAQLGRIKDVVEGRDHRPSDEKRARTLILLNRLEENLKVTAHNLRRTPKSLGIV